MPTIPGSAQDDTLTGGGDDDTLLGYGGNDLLQGGGGRNTLSGGDGDDVYWVQSDLVADNHVFDSGGAADTLRVLDTAGRDAYRLVYTGTALVHETWQGHRTTIELAPSGAPVVEFLQWVGRPELGTGDYVNTLRIVTDLSNISGRLIAVAGTDGADVIVMPNEAPQPGEYWGEVYANDGNDRITLSSTLQYVTYGGGGNDRISGRGAINDVIAGDDGRDVIRGAGGADTISGDAGNDTLYGGLGDDLLTGGDGDDVIYGGAGNDTIDDGAGDDTIDGGAGIDTFTRDYTFATDFTLSLVIDLDAGEVSSHDFPSAQPDVLISIENVIVRGAAHFILLGSDASNALTAADGADLLVGGRGHDSLRGSGGNDTLRGGDGNDLLEGGAGRDRLTGGNGADVFVFRSVRDSGPAVAKRDVITDFRAGLDIIDLRAIDADTGLAGDQAFRFIGAAGFGGSAGELRFANATVWGDVNGDGRADFAIGIIGARPLTAEDFLL